MCPTPSSPPPTPTGQSPRRGERRGSIPGPAHAAQTIRIPPLCPAAASCLLHPPANGGYCEFSTPGFILSMQSVQSFERECSRFDCLHIGSLNGGGRASPNEVAFPLPASTQWTISEPDAVTERGSGRDRETGHRALRECACTMGPSCQTPAAASILRTNNSRIVFA